ncbi:hypothetical protein [Streptomyces sp. NPDC002403]
MDARELAITVGLGLVARKAAATEYVLHGIYVHLAGVAKAYTKPGTPTATGGQLVKQCRGLLTQVSDPDTTAPGRTSLEQDLNLAEEGFRLRNRYFHGCWQLDPETQTWLTLKGAHGTERPEITFVSRGEVWRLAARFQELHDRLVQWDIAHHGELTAGRADRTGSALIALVALRSGWADDGRDATKPRAKGGGKGGSWRPLPGWPAVKAYAGKRLYLLRHGHKEWIDEDGHSRVAVESRMGHEIAGVEGTYSNVTPNMERAIMDSLQARWMHFVPTLGADWKPTSPKPLPVDLPGWIKKQVSELETFG